jgi:hypothetical protein
MKRVAALMFLVLAAPPARAVSVRALPDTAWIEPGRGLQRVLDRWVGDKRVPVSDGFIDTGDVIESR